VPILTKRAEEVAKAVPRMEETLNSIDFIRKHPGLEAGTGLGGRIARSIPGTAAYGFDNAIEQLKGKTFLQAYGEIKGAGAISNAEGQAATASVARINPNQDKKDLDRALNDFEQQVRGDLEKVQRRMNMPVTAWYKGEGPELAPDIGQRGRRGGVIKEYIGGNPGLDSSYRDVR
jgi:hypothetical protein